MESAFAAFGNREIGNADYARSNQKTFAIFLRKSVLDPWASREQGKPVHVSRDFCRIQHAGERDHIEVPVKLDEHPQLYPRQWEAFQREVQQVPDGTPLTVLFPDQPHIADNLKHWNVLTVEQLAVLEGTALTNIGAGALEWKRKAVQFQEAAQTSAPLRHLEAQLEQRDDRIKQLEEALTATTARLDALEQETPPPRRGPGRPPNRPSEQE